MKKSVTTSLGLDVSSDEEDAVEDGRADIFKRREAREGPEGDSGQGVFSATVRLLCLLDLFNHSRFLLRRRDSEERREPAERRGRGE